MRRLRWQLIGVLVLAVLLPLLPAAFAARELFRRSLDPLLAAGLAESADAGLAMTRDVLDAHKRRWLDALAAGAPAETLRASPEGASVPAGDGAPLGPLRLLAGPQVRLGETSAALVACVRGAGGAPVWIGTPLPDSLASRAAAIERGARLLGSLRRERASLQRGLEATFLVVDVAIVLAVLALGLWLTSRLTRPLAELSRGIDRVAAGDLAARVPERGSAEVLELTRRFNAMAATLQHQHAELARLERVTAWRQTARFLAHEIKNPLTPIQLAAEQMRDAYTGDDLKYRKLIEESAAIVEEEVLAMRNLVAEFSQFARLPECRPASVDAAELAQELAGLYGDALAVSPLPAAGLSLWCDRDAIKRALVNLIDNALAAQRAIGCGTPVALAIAPASGGAARLVVRDRGPGIPDEKKRRVFEPDYTTKRDGMGLGLAIAEHLVIDHGGTVEVTDAEGGGAAFTVTLPGRGAHEGDDA